MDNVCLRCQVHVNYPCPTCKDLREDNYVWSRPPTLTPVWEEIYLRRHAWAWFYGDQPVRQRPIPVAAPACDETVDPDLIADAPQVGALPVLEGAEEVEEKEAKTPGKWSKCKRCEKQFAQEFTADMHASNHMPDRPHVCPRPECTKCFAMEIALRRHLRQVHDTAADHKCPHPECYRRYTRKSSLRRHMESCKFVEGGKRGATTAKLDVDKENQSQEHNHKRQKLESP